MAKHDSTPIAGNSFLFVKIGSVLHKLDLREILWISSKGNYITINTKSKGHIVKMSLRKVLQFLPLEFFVQVHRSYIVQKSYITRIDMGLNEVYIEQTPVPLGRKFKENLLEQLKLLK